METKAKVCDLESLSVVAGENLPRGSDEASFYDVAKLLRAQAACIAQLRDRVAILEARLGDSAD